MNRQVKPAQGISKSFNLLDHPIVTRNIDRGNPQILQRMLNLFILDPATDHEREAGSFPYRRGDRDHVTVHTHLAGDGCLSRFGSHVGL